MTDLVLHDDMTTTDDVRANIIAITQTIFPFNKMCEIQEDNNWSFIALKPLGSSSASPFTPSQPLVFKDTYFCRVNLQYHFKDTGQTQRTIIASYGCGGRGSSILRPLPPLAFLLHQSTHNTPTPHCCCLALECIELCARLVFDSKDQLWRWLLSRSRIKFALIFGQWTLSVCLLVCSVYMSALRLLVGSSISPACFCLDGVEPNPVYNIKSTHTRSKLSPLVIRAPLLLLLTANCFALSVLRSRVQWLLPNITGVVIIIICAI